MEEKNLQQQINNLDQKLDRLLEFVEMQNRKREEFDDLITDVSIVAKDAFRNSVTMLDKAQVELDSCGISCLVIRFLQNLDTLHEMLGMMESARDFMKDVTPILHQVGLDAVHKMNELDQKGYFEYMKQMAALADKWIEVFPAGEVKNLEDNLEHLAGILKNLSDPDVIKTMQKASDALAHTRIDKDEDVLSMWQILKQMRSKEVRRSISWSLKVVKTIAN
jgi:uncharacterized protein YjgD (DUF1641 family)